MKRVNAALRNRVALRIYEPCPDHSTPPEGVPRSSEDVCQANGALYGPMPRRPAFGFLISGFGFISHAARIARRSGMCLTTTATVATTVNMLTAVTTATNFRKRPVFAKNRTSAEQISCQSRAGGFLSALHLSVALASTLRDYAIEERSEKHLIRQRITIRSLDVVTDRE